MISIFEKPILLGIVALSLCSNINADEINFDDFYVNDSFRTDIKREYRQTVVLKYPISCKTGQIVKIKKQEYSKLLSKFKNEATIRYRNIFFHHKSIELASLIEFTQVFKGKRYFCIRKNRFYQVDTEAVLKNDNWRTSNVN